MALLVEGGMLYRAWNEPLPPLGPGDVRRPYQMSNTERAPLILVPITGGAVLLGHDASELRAAIDSHDKTSSPVSTLADRVFREGLTTDAASGYVGVPLYVRSTIAGLIAAHFPPRETSRLGEHADTLAVIATRFLNRLQVIFVIFVRPTSH